MAKRELAKLRHEGDKKKKLQVAAAKMIRTMPCVSVPDICRKGAVLLFILEL